MQSLLRHYQQQFDQLNTCQSDWDVYRKDAFKQLQVHGLPTIKHESWRAIARSPFLQQLFSLTPLTPSKKTLEYVASLAAKPSNAIRLFWCDGQLYRPALSSDLPYGVKIHSTDAVLKKNPQRLFRSDFDKAHQLGHGFNAINRTFSHSGVCIDVKDDCKIEPLIELYYVFDVENIQGQNATMCCLRHDIQVGQNSGIKLVEYTISHMSAENVTAYPCLNTLTTLTLQRNAKASVSQAVNTDAHHIYLGHLAVKQYQNSALYTESLVNGDGLTRQLINADLYEPGANCDVRGLGGVTHKQQIDHQVLVNHHADHTVSEIQYRGIADDQGQISFNGEVVAQPGIRQMRSDQGNHHLLLSDQAEIQTKPRLALFAGDIQCTHGATVGALDNQALAYLRARGIAEADARLLLVQAFSQTLWQTMPTLAANPLLLTHFLEKMQTH